MSMAGSKRKSSSTGGRAAKRSRKEDDAETKVFSDGFDENCIGDEEDQAYLNSLTEVEREKVLAARREARDDELDMQLFAERSGGVQVEDDDNDDDEEDDDAEDEEEEEEESEEEDTTEVGGKRLRRRSRRADDASDSEESLGDLDTSGRVHTKGTGDGDEDSDFEDLSAKEKRKRRMQKFKQQRVGGAASGAGAGVFDEDDEDDLLGDLGDDDDFVRTVDRHDAEDDHRDYDSDVEEEERARDARLQKERMEPLTVRDINQARLTRQFLLHFFLEPYFKSMIKGMFVRVLLGTDSDTGSRVYRLCRIKEVARGRTAYEITVKGEKIKTHRRLVLYQGTPDDTKPFRVMLVSDQRASDEELQAFLHECKQTQTEPPTPAELRRRRRRAERIRKSHTYTTEDIERMLAMKQASFDPKKVGNPTLYRIELEQKVQSLIESKERATARPMAAREKILQEAGSEPAAQRRAEQLQREAAEIERKFGKQIELARRHLDAIRAEAERRQGRERTVSMHTASAINNRFRDRNRKAEVRAAREQARLRKDSTYQHHVRNKAVGFIRRERKVEILWKIGLGEKGGEGEGEEKGEGKEGEGKEESGGAAGGGGGEEKGEEEGEEGTGASSLLAKLGASPSRPLSSRRGAGRGTLAVGGVDVEAALREAIGEESASATASSSSRLPPASSSSSKGGGVAAGKPKLSMRQYLARKKAAAGGGGVPT